MELTLEIILTYILFLANLSMMMYTFKSRTKLNRPKILGIWLAGSLLAVAFAVLLTLYPPPVQFQLAYIIIFCTVTVVICRLLFHCKYTELIFVYFIIQGYIDDCFMVTKWLQNFFVIRDNEYISLFIPYFLIMLLFFPLMLILLKKLRKLIQTTENLKFWSFIWIMPLSFYLVYRISISPKYLNIALRWNDASAITPLLWTVATMLSNYTIITTLLGIVKHSEKEKELQLSTQMLEYQKEEYEKLQISIEEMHKTKHDFRHHINAMSGMLENGQLSNLKSYMKQYADEIESTEKMLFCDNYALNAILRHYLKNCEVHGIQFTVDIQLPEETKCPENEMCVLLGNLLENALEACLSSQCLTPYISVIIKDVSSCTLALTVTNTHSRHIKSQGNKFLSSKRNYNEFGVGLSSVKNIVDKYHGYIKIEHDETTFRVSVIL